jgi:predicted RNA binding protein YcfA (HicA-like mRNA interferase family)
MLGFTHVGGKGSHRVYAKRGERTALNFQNRKGKIAPYQARQLIEMIDKYESEL